MRNQLTIMGNNIMSIEDINVEDIKNNTLRTSKKNQDKRTMRCNENISSILKEIQKKSLRGENRLDLAFYKACTEKEMLAFGARMEEKGFSVTHHKDEDFYMGLLDKYVNIQW
jgi:PAB1-binding protein PBP1